MKQRLIAVLLLILSAVLLLSGCVDQPKNYTVTFVLGDGRDSVITEVSSDSKLYTPTPVSDEYVFGGWFLDPELTKPYLSHGVNADLTLYARFIKRGERVVTILYKNGTPDTTIVMSGALTEPDEPHREGYVFTGWYDASTGERYVFGTEPTADHTVIRAGWREQSEGVTLTLHPENGEPSSVITYNFSAIPARPQAPENGELDFLGWYKDPECRELFDFTAPLTADTDVYAGWHTDLTDLAERVATEVLTSTVKIHARMRNLATTAISLGSGVIYAYHGGYYYVLTNEHVVATQSGYFATDYSVFDAYGNEYAATCLAMDAAYDLAVLRFAPGTVELDVSPLRINDPKVGELLVSVGNPGGVFNTVTFGKVAQYGLANVSGGAVEFEVGWHDAYLASGSSGGGVFNKNAEFVGINFAAGGDDEGNFTYGAFIQSSKVAEFLAENNLYY